MHSETEPPDCPTDLKATDIESRSITINWGHPFSGNAPLSNYIIEYREQMEGEVSSTGAVVVVDRSNSARSSAERVPSSSSEKKTEMMTNRGGGGGGKTFKEILESKSSSYIIQRLQPHTPYFVRVFAQNSLGISSDCSPLRVTTEREAPASPPRFVH
jgi:hypothetical protein